MITKLTAEPEGYAECYPGLVEMNDAIDDSDDEVDYTKMGMKKYFNKLVIYLNHQFLRFGQQEGAYWTMGL